MWGSAATVGGVSRNGGSEGFRSSMIVNEKSELSVIRRHVYTFRFGSTVNLFRECWTWKGLDWKPEAIQEPSRGI